MDTKMIKVIIEVDVNDGDYVTKMETVEEAEFDRFLPVIQELDNTRGQWGYHHNFEVVQKKVANKEYDNEFIELFDEFRECYVPYFDNHDVHTIVSIRYHESVDEYELIS